MFVYISVKVERRGECGDAVPLTVDSAGPHLHRLLFLLCCPLCSLLPPGGRSGECSAHGALALFTHSAPGRRVARSTSACVTQQTMHNCKDSAQSQGKRKMSVFLLHRGTTGN